MTVHSLPPLGAEDMLAQQRTRVGRWKMLAVLLVCAAPVVASYFTYYVIRPEGRRNYGELIEPQRPLPASLAATAGDGKPVPLASLRGQWLLVSAAGGACDSRCENHLYLQRQLRETLGKGGMDAAFSTPQELGAIAAKDYPRWGEVIKRNGIAAAGEFLLDALSRPDGVVDADLVLTPAWCQLPFTHGWDAESMENAAGTLVSLRSALNRNVQDIQALQRAPAGSPQWRALADRAVWQRGVLDGTASIIYLTALFHLPLANATAINLASPLFILVLAVLFFGERLVWVRTLAALVGPVFDRIAGSLVDAFVKRAEQVYG